jgi:hypothetical protein
MGSSILGTLMLLSVTVALLQSNGAGATGCGERVTIATHDRTTTLHALAYPQPAPSQGARFALVLLVSGGGHLNLDDKGCPRGCSPHDTCIGRKSPAQDWHGALRYNAGDCL